jgi:FixJ family two-component response regulator
MARDIEVPTGAPPMVYIVEDDPSSRRAFVRLVRSHGFNAEAFAWPAQILRRLQSGQRHCAVLVLDIHLGKTSGFDLHDRLTRMGVSIPTIFMTGHDDAANRERVSRVGAKAYLVKPFDDAALIGAIEVALEGCQARPS